MAFNIIAYPIHSDITLSTLSLIHSILPQVIVAPVSDHSKLSDMKNSHNAFTTIIIDQSVIRPREAAQCLERTINQETQAHRIFMKEKDLNSLLINYPYDLSCDMI